MKPIQNAETFPSENEKKNGLCEAFPESSGLVEELLRDGLMVRTVPVGGSMLPFIRGGRDTVVLKPAKATEVHLFDAVLFRRNDGRLVLHRLVGKKDSFLITRGDSQRRSERVAPENILAVAVSVERRGKKHCLNTTVHRAKIHLWMALPFLRPFMWRCIRLRNRIKNQSSFSSK